MKNILTIRNLSKSFTLHYLKRQIDALHNVNMDLIEGEFAGITGKSGSGKSTLLKCIYRTYLTQQGSIIYNSDRFGPLNISTASERQIVYIRKHEIGYVSQFLNIMPRTTAIEAVCHAVMEMGHEKNYAKDKAESILEHFELDKELWDSYPITFSGGEKLRLNIARAMVKHPKLLLLDEPTASLDCTSKMKVRELIEQLLGEGTTMLGIFHDIEFMENLCTKEYRMHEGRLFPAVKEGSLA